MMELSFMCKKKILARLKRKNICINVFGYKKGLIFPIYVSDQKFENSMDLLLSIDDKSHYVYIKDFNSFMFHKTKNKNKKYFIIRVAYSVLETKMCYQNIKKTV